MSSYNYPDGVTQRSFDEYWDEKLGDYMEDFECPYCGCLSGKHEIGCPEMEEVDGILE